MNKKTKKRKVTSKKYYCTYCGLQLIADKPEFIGYNVYTGKAVYIRSIKCPKLMSWRRFIDLDHDYISY